MRTVSVKGFQTGSYGTKYDLVYADDGELNGEYAGSVEVTPLANFTHYSVRDRFNEPVLVDSPRYSRYVAAVAQHEAEVSHDHA